jgi:hypothetical protein
MSGSKLRASEYESESKLSQWNEGGLSNGKKKKLHGLSPRTNYTDRATAAGRRSDCQLFYG